MSPITERRCSHFEITALDINSQKALQVDFVSKGHSSPTTAAGMNQQEIECVI